MAALLLGLSLLAHGSESAKGDEGPEPDPGRDERLKESQQITQGVITVDGQRIEYRAVAGLLQIDDRKEEPSALMSYVAYFGKAGATPRPVVFLYNGGPGSSTIWLHMGAFGPKPVLTGNGRQLPIPAAQRANIAVHHCPAGHMMYDDPASLKMLRDNVVRFLRP